MMSGEYIKTEHGYVLAALLPSEHKDGDKECQCERCQKKQSKDKQGEVEEVKECQ